MDKDWEVNYHTFSELVSTLLEFEEGLEWDSEDYNEAYTDFKLWLGHVSLEYMNKVTDEQMVRDFCKEFYQDCSSATHSYWVKGKDALYALITHERRRYGFRPGFGIARMDFQYHGKWDND